MMALFTIHFVMEVTTFHPQIIYKGRSFYDSYRIVQYSREPLFSLKDSELSAQIKASFLESLNQNKIPDLLLKEFQKEKITLSSKASLAFEQKEQAWKITDSSDSWLLKREGDAYCAYPENLPVSALVLFQGSTVHGGEFRDAKENLIPLTYYHCEAGVYDAFRKFSPEKIGILGLGSGILALVAKKGQSIDFYEIDPLVVDLAKNRFSILASSPAQIQVILGDGRRQIAKRPPGTYDLLILDAFTSDAIPTHLLTIEAVEVYLRVLKPDGMIFFNISNRYLNLLPVLSGSAQKFNLSIASHTFAGRKKEFKFATVWVALSRDAHKIETLCKDGIWKKADGKKIEWRDDYNFLWPLLKRRW
jgi:SAM-dependent methyltransferase